MILMVVMIVMMIRMSVMIVRILMIMMLMLLMLMIMRMMMLTCSLRRIRLLSFADASLARSSATYQIHFEIRTNIIRNLTKYNFKFDQIHFQFRQIYIANSMTPPWRPTKYNLQFNQIKFTISANIMMVIMVRQ